MGIFAMYRVLGIRKRAMPFKVRFALAVLLGYCIASTLRRICLSKIPIPGQAEGGESDPGGGNVQPGKLRNFLTLFGPKMFKPGPSTHPKTTRDLVLVGIMTADKYIDSRAKAIYDTWARSIPGKVLFFVGSGSSYVGGLPVVRLADVPAEDYPPQKKAFRMLEYMYKNHRHQYEWFFRADDDVYVKGEKIEALLRSVNSSKLWYLGQSGEGQVHEQGKLGLIEDMPYCMGGPGVVLSHVALTKLGPHIPDCIESVTTKHEDTEVGRCIQKTVGIGCTSAYELRKLLYQNYREKNGSFTHALGNEEKMAYTLHPIKQGPYVYRMHNYIKGGNVASLHNKVMRLQAEIKLFEKNILMTKVDYNSIIFRNDSLLQLESVMPGTWSDDSKYVWEYFNKGVFFTHKSVHLQLQTSGRINDESVSTISQNLSKRLRETFSHSYMKLDKRLASYIRIIPLEWVEMDISLRVSYISKFSKDIRRFIAPLKLKQPFTHFEFFEGKDSFRAYTTNVETVSPMRMLIPLSGKTAILKRFLIKHLPLIPYSVFTITMVFIVFQDPKGDHVKCIQIIESFQKAYPTCDVRIINRSEEIFSRANALTTGANLFKNDSLLVFMDVDMIFTMGYLERVQRNTVQGRQIYFPVYFSQFDPNLICYIERNCSVTDFGLDASSGIWRSYGYGMVGVYKSDFLVVGGFNTTIVGWGKEDVDFHERVLKYGYSAFRAADPGLVHLYHEKICESSLALDQWEMCTKSKADLWSSTRTLTRMMVDLPAVDAEDDTYDFLLDSLEKR